MLSEVNFISEDNFDIVVDSLLESDAGIFNLLRLNSNLRRWNFLLDAYLLEGDQMLAVEPVKGRS